MKKILFSLVALVASMSMNAQVMKVMKNGEEVAKYRGAEYSVVFEEEAQGSTTTGTAKRTGDIEVKWVQLWENGPKFAEYNVGATSVSGYGGYYSWGGSVNLEGTTGMPTYNTGTSELTGDDDTVTKLWGTNWRMPKKDELQALLDNCTFEWTTVNGVNGRKYTGKGDYASNSVFLPAADYCDNGDVNDLCCFGYYWSSTPIDSEGAYFLYFYSSGSQFVNGCYFRSNGFSVRAVLAEEPTTTGTAKRTGDIEVNWVQLWENGPKFAEYNVGAENNKAEDYGGYYCWGSTIDKDENGNYKRGTDVLTGDYDTATKLWGSNWRMPSKDELQALLDNCDAEWTTENCVNGCKFTGKGDYSSNSVFLPAAGYWDQREVTGFRCSYWSSTPDGLPNRAFCLSFNSDYQSKYGVRYHGYSVRAVLAE